MTPGHQATESGQQQGKMSAREATESLRSCKCPNVIPSKQINLQAASVHGFSVKMRKSSLHMRDTAQCIKKRHREAFSDKLKQLEKHRCLWSIIGSFCLPGLSKVSPRRNVKNKIWEKHLTQGYWIRSYKTGLFTFFKNLQTRPSQNIPQQANSYCKLLPGLCPHLPFSHLISEKLFHDDHIE